MSEDAELARLQAITDDRDHALERIGRGTGYAILGFLVMVFGMLAGVIAVWSRVIELPTSLAILFGASPGGALFLRGMSGRRSGKRELRDAYASLELPEARLIISSTADRSGS